MSLSHPNPTGTAGPGGFIPDERHGDQPREVSWGSHMMMGEQYAYSPVMLYMRVYADRAANVE